MTDPEAIRQKRIAEILDAAIDFIADEYRTRDYEDQGEWLPPKARAIHAKLIELRYGHTAPPRPDASGLIDAAENVAIAFGMGWDMDGVIGRLIEMLPPNSVCRSRAAVRSAPRSDKGGA